jgi:hypothetical protein
MDDIVKLAQSIWDNCTITECTTDGTDSDIDMTENENQPIIVGEDQCKQTWDVELQGTETLLEEMTNLLGKGKLNGRKDTEIHNWKVDGVGVVLNARDNDVMLYQYYSKVGR